MQNKVFETVESFNLKIVEDVPDVKRYTKLKLVDSDGYLYYLSGDNLANTARKCGVLAKFFHNNPFTKENIDNYIKLNIGDHIQIVDFNGAKSAKDLFWVRCSKHGATYQRYWNIIKNGQYCNECGMERYKSSRKNSMDEIKVIAREKYNIKILSMEYINNLEPLEFVCNKHEYLGVQTRAWGQIITTKHSCAECAKEATSYLNTITHDEFMSKTTDDCKVIVLGTYNGCKNKILVKCKICGEEFYMRPDHIINEVGCGKCEISKGESKVMRVLDNMQIKYIPQHQFGDCILNKRDMPFDFYIPSLKIAIEYDGVQHFEPVEHFGGEEQFIIQQNNDRFKNEYCVDNNIALIRIPYWEYENIEEILLDKIKPI